MKKPFVEPDWHRAYASALKEPVTVELPAALERAERSIFTRLGDLQTLSREERNEIANAAVELRRLRSSLKSRQ